MNRIEFTLPDVGLREIEGIIWVEDGFIVLEMKNALFGLVDADHQTIKIEPSALKEVVLRRWPFKDRLLLVPKKRDLLDAVPGKHVNELKLRIWGTKRNKVRQLIWEIDHLREQADRA